MREIYYFGCVGEVGHGFYGGAKGTWLDNPSPWPRVDGALTPGRRDSRGRLEGKGKQGEASLHHLGGWTALAIHDFSVDSRPGSNSVFLIHDTLDLTQALAIAGKREPAMANALDQSDWLNSPAIKHRCCGS
jgi:hypothetical protein